MLKHFILGLAAASTLSLAACASAPGKEDTEVATESELHCQTDDATGSRLTHTTTCNSDNTSAASYVRGIQNTPNIGPRGN